MTDSPDELSPRLAGRVAGLLYLVTIGGGVFAQFFVRSALIVRNNPTATAAHLLHSESLYRMGAAAEFISIAAYVAVTALLYRLLRPAGRTLSLVAAFMSLVGCAIGAANLVNHIAPLVVLADASYLSAFTADQLQALALVSLKLQGQSANIALLFFGAYCFIVGCLIVRSTFIPGFVGAMMAIAGLAWLVDGFAVILSPTLAASLTLAPAIGIAGEGTVCAWLVLVGVNVERWNRRAAAGDRVRPAVG